MNSEGEEPRDNKSSTGTAARKHRLDFDQEDVPPLEGEELEELRASLVPLQSGSVDTVPHAPEVVRDQDVDRSRQVASPGASEAMAAPMTEGSVEHPRAPILTILTATPGPMQTSLVSHMDVPQGKSTAAPSSELEVSSYLTTVNDGGDGLSPDVITTGAYTDQLDLSSVSFSFPTTDPAVLRTRIVLVSEPEEDLSRLDVFEHGRQVLERIKQRRQPSIRDAQQYFDRLRATHFGSFSIPQKEQLTETANRIVEQLGWVTVLLCDPNVGEARITKMRCYVPKRSKGSIQARLGSTTVYTGTSWPVLIVRDRDQKSLDAGRGIDDEKTG